MYSCVHVQKDLERKGVGVFAWHLPKEASSSILYSWGLQLLAYNSGMFLPTCWYSLQQSAGELIALLGPTIHGQLKAGAELGSAVPGPIREVVWPGPRKKGTKPEQSRHLARKGGDTDKSSDGGRRDRTSGHHACREHTEGSTQRSGVGRETGRTCLCSPYQEVSSRSLPLPN